MTLLGIPQNKRSLQLPLFPGVQWTFFVGQPIHPFSRRRNNLPCSENGVTIWIVLSSTKSVSQVSATGKGSPGRVHNMSLIIFKIFFYRERTLFLNLFNKRTNMPQTANVVTVSWIFGYSLSFLLSISCILSANFFLELFFNLLILLSWSSFLCCPIYKEPLLLASEHASVICLFSG